MAGLAFHGLKAGGQYIPDSAFEKIPFAGPKWFKENQDNQQNQQDKSSNRSEGRQRPRTPPRSNRDQYYDDDSEWEAERRARRSHRRSAREERRRQNRGYDSDPESPAVSRGYNNNQPQNENDYPYFPPPPTQAVNEPDMRNAQASTYNGGSQPYTPGQDVKQDPYAQWQGDNPEYPPPPGPPPGHNSRTRFDSGTGTAGDTASGTRSSVADRYKPADYNSPPSSARYDRGGGMSPTLGGARDSPRPNYPSAVAIRPHSPYYGSQESLSPSYDSRYDDDEYDRRHRRKHRASSKGSRHRSSSRFSVNEVREKAQEGFKQHKGEIEAGALGALAGGLLGREFGGKKGNLGMVIGAALGGVGAGLYGARQQKQKQRLMVRERSASRPRSREYDGYESY